MAENRTVSIIVPVYRAERYIENTIQMVLGQTYSDWELILVDDHSPDGSGQVIEDLIDRLRDDRIRLISRERNEGAAAARNTGLDAAAGRYIAFLDADDVWMPERLQAGLEYMDRKQVGFVFSAYEFGDENAVPTGRVVHVPETLSYRQALSRTVVFTTTTLFDTKVIPRELLHMPPVASEDTATWWQILRNGYTAYGLDRVLAVYRRPAGSLSSNKLLAVKRIFALYRKQEKLGILPTCYYFFFWALRATLRRI